MTSPAEAIDYSVLVRSVTYEADGVISMRLEGNGEPLPVWDPGAHIDVLLDDAGARHYSLCGDVSDRAAYRIAVLLEDDGRGGSKLLHTSVRAGDWLRIRPPRNHFVLEEASGYVFIAGGIGITPLLPMIAEVHNRGVPWQLHFAGRSRAAMPFLAELHRYGASVHTYPGDEGRRLDVQGVLEGAASDSLIYVCGPSRLSDAVSRAAGAAGAARVRRELFAVPEMEDGTDGTDGAAVTGFTVHLKKSGLDLEVPEDKSVLDVMLEAGVDVLHDCRDGICGSCETPVLEGEVDHRDYVLTNQERLESSCMMVCVSRAACSRLVLGA